MRSGLLTHSRPPSLPQTWTPHHRPPPPPASSRPLAPSRLALELARRPRSSHLARRHHSRFSRRRAPRLRTADQPSGRGKSTWRGSEALRPALREAAWGVAMGARAGRGGTRRRVLIIAFIIARARREARAGAGGAPRWSCCAASRADLGGKTWRSSPASSAWKPSDTEPAIPVDPGSMVYFFLVNESLENNLLGPFLKLFQHGRTCHRSSLLLPKINHLQTTRKHQRTSGETDKLLLSCQGRGRRKA
uniref:Uncharacterized protein LOC110213018 n=1 Tax=Phascolarctos cinereus TaxID=38626 RepID=A0A6P5KZP3_PHACI|nr:uncharacterized protein LOC110213018 [Phascolarctos cinereus]